MHALTAMTREIRAGRAKKGLVLANGGVATYQHAVVLSASPRQTPYPAKNILPPLVTDVNVPTLDAVAEGDAVVETYTVDFDRQNKPVRGHVVGRLKETGHRFIANNGDDTTLQQLASLVKDPIGRPGFVKQDSDKKGRNLFVFAGSGRL